MRAVLCKQWGLPETLVLEELPSPQPGDDEVVISVKAVGVSFPDVLTIQGKYQSKPAFPFTPGGDVAGTIKAVGKNVTAFRVGDAVFGKAKESCAEEVVADPKKLFRMPAGVDYAVAAGFGNNYQTSLYALRERGQLKAGETVLILGASGGVGLAAIELAKMMGARVIACASTQEKLDVCKRVGADDLINYETENLRERIKELTNDRGVDIVYDPVGDKYADPAVRGLAWGGRYLVVGFAAGEIPKIPLNLPLLKGGAIVGVWSGGFTRNEPQKQKKLFEELVGMLGAGKIKPFISETFPLERTADALRALMTRKAVGKIVVVTGK
jgi:NADPH2:quinone reductase